MINVQKKYLKNMTFIDLFSGLGGFRLALESLGAKCVYSSDSNKAVQQIYKENFGELPAGDITKIDEKTIPNHDILCAGFPCQAFSISGKQKGFEDSRGTLFFDVARIIKEKKPKIVFMENVKNFAKHNNGNTLKVVQTIIEDLGYKFYQKVLNASDYNIPQNRERIYIVCFREDLNIESFEYPEALPLNRCVEDFVIKDDNTVNHLYVFRSDYVINNIENENKNKPIRIGSINKGRQGERIYSIKGVAITLSAYGGGIFAKTGGYLINNKVRKLHPRECARIMGYPDTYKLDSKPNQAYQQFGNSVVVDVLQYIAIEIGKSITK